MYACVYVCECVNACTCTWMQLCTCAYVAGCLCTCVRCACSALCNTAAVDVFLSPLLSGANVYSYLFAHAPSWGIPLLGAYHASEIDFVYSNIDIRPNPTPSEYDLASSMTTYWTQFGNHADPNVPNLASLRASSSQHLPAPANFPVWPSYTVATNYTRLVLNLTSYTVQNIEQQQCAFWSTLY